MVFTNLPFLENDSVEVGQTPENIQHLFGKGFLSFLVVIP